VSKRNQNQALTEVTFQCGCGKFKAAPDRIEDAPEDEYHPWRYFAVCPRCGAESNQAAWERALLKAWSNSTGPKTAAGKAASAANLEGHPTKEESLRTRFNAMKHGASAKVATYFPARPGKYALCNTCDVDRVWCQQQPCCVKQTQNFMLHQAAFEQRKPGVLQGMYSEMQAAVYSILQQIILTIINDGVKVERPEFHFDSNGTLVLARYTDEWGDQRTITEISAHPLLKPLTDFLSKNNLTLADMGMTNKVVDEEDIFPGHLGGSTAAPAISVDEYQRRKLEALEDLRNKVMRANASTAADPILLEHEAENAGAQARGAADVIDVQAVEKK